MKKLKSYMRKNKVTSYRLAKKLGISHVTVIAWLAGRTRPGVLKAINLERATGGAVSVYDWE